MLTALSAICFAFLSLHFYPQRIKWVHVKAYKGTPTQIEDPYTRKAQMTYTSGQSEGRTWQYTFWTWELTNSIAVICSNLSSGSYHVSGSMVVTGDE